MKNCLSKLISLVFICVFSFSSVFARNPEQSIVQMRDGINITQLCQTINLSYGLLKKIEANTKYGTNTSGWHFLKVEYIVSIEDGVQTNHFANGDIYTETRQGIGKKTILLPQ